MSLTERYIYAVTRHLPFNQRDEVAEELRASIHDMATDRAKNGKPKESDIKAALTELGDPTVLAGKYGNAKRYLIGPQWFDAYWGVLKQILYIVPAIIVCVMLIVNFAIVGRSWIEAIIHAIGSGFAAAIQIAFWTTLTFFILERSGDVNPKDITGQSKGNDVWSPEDLPFPPKKRQIPAVEAWISVAFIVTATGWIALSPIWGNNWLNPDLWQFWIPAFLALSAASTVHYIFRAIIGNWTTPLVISNIILSVVSITYIIVLVSTQTVISAELLQSLPAKEGIDLDQSANWVHLTTSITTVVIVAIYIWEAIDSIVKNRQYAKTRH